MFPRYGFNMDLHKYIFFSSPVMEPGKFISKRNLFIFYCLNDFALEKFCRSHTFPWVQSKIFLN